MTTTTEPAIRTNGLDRLFRPDSIAVVGASTTPGKLGTAMTAALRRGAAPAAVFGVNPTAEGFVPNLEEACRAHGRPVDLAVLCIPAAATPAAVRAAAECGVGAALICSGGFAETGPDGAARQQELAAIVAETGIRILGPNTSGFFRPGAATVSFVPAVEHIRPGRVAVVAASGGMNHALSFLLSEHSVGVGLGVGLGNRVDVTEVDVLQYLRDDPAISAVALHLETVDDGPALLAAVRLVTAGKPVVALVVGRSDVSAFAGSHTGALATSWRTTRALLAQAGAVVVDSEQQLVDALAVLSRVRLPAHPDPGVGVVTAQAGPGLVVLDGLQAGGVRVPALADATRAELAGLLPPLTFQGNPVDTGRPGPGFGDVLAVTARDPEVHALAVYTLAEPDAVDPVGAVSDRGIHRELPVVLGIGGPAVTRADFAAAADAHNIPVLPGPTALATGLGALVTDARARYLRNRGYTRPGLGPTPEIALPADEAAAKDLLEALGLRTPPRCVCHDHDAAHRALRDLTPPVAVKLLDAGVLHKTDIGGVHLGIRTAAELDTALTALDAVGARAYLVETMAETGVDLFLGVRRDPVFGLVVVAGLGGTAAEALGDIAVRGLPLHPTAATALLDDLRCAPLLNGRRGGPVLDRDEFARAVIAVGDHLAAHPEIGELEINPLRLTPDGLIALDAVITGSDVRPANPEDEQR
ncbi:acetate--CoA ligase family protein [Nocardia testacea]|uniref:Acetate--CoA ligase family protein n=1 Tax=Nocardia testacea TaxID=248551 RepID=A0ABW7VQA0_9NOCA